MKRDDENAEVTREVIITIALFAVGFMAAGSFMTWFMWRWLV